MSLWSQFKDWWTSGIPKLEDKPYEIPDPEADTLQEMETRDEEQTKSVNLLTIHFK